MTGPGTPASDKPRSRKRLLIVVAVLGAVGALAIRHFGGTDGANALDDFTWPTTGATSTSVVAPSPAGDAAGTGVTAATSATGSTATTGTTVSTSTSTSTSTSRAGVGRDPFAATLAAGASGAPPGPDATDTTDATAATAATGVPAGDPVSGAGDPASIPTPVYSDPGPGAPDPVDPDPTGSGSAGDVPETTTTVPGTTTTTRPPTVGLERSPAGGYWLFQSDGSVYASSPAYWSGDLRTVSLLTPIVGMQATATGRGYYLVSRDGGVFAFGDAVYNGSLPETLAGSLSDLLDQGYLAPTSTAPATTATTA